MRKHFNVAVFVVMLIAARGALAQTPGIVFPGTAWEKASPQEMGWSAAKLEEARTFAATMPPASVIVVDRGRLIAQWGDPAKKVKISSARKSLLSAMYGIYVRNGEIDLNKNLAQLGIDDDPPLTQAERQATVRMLLQARSGIYHSYVAGTPSMRVDMPVRGSHPPGTFWFYNNWDFNALGGIFEQQVHTKIGVEFRDKIAAPVHMQDFQLEDMYYLRADPKAGPDGQSIYPAYHFRLTAQDMARFGYLFLRKGNWNGTQIIPGDWVTESTTSYSDAGDGEGYGYLWWVNSLGVGEKNFSAQGALGKYIVVFPDRDLVVVYQNHTEFPDDAAGLSAADVRKLPNITDAQISQLLKMLLQAQRPTQTR